MHRTPTGPWSTPVVLASAPISSFRQASRGGILNSSIVDIYEFNINVDAATHCDIRGPIAPIFLV